MAEFFDENKRDEMKRKWMRLAMEAQEDGNTALANHYLKAAFVETDTDAALKGEKLGKFKGRSKGQSKTTLQRMEFLNSKRAELGAGHVDRFVQDVWDNHADEVKKHWGDGDAETLIKKMTHFAKNHIKKL